MNHPRLRIFNSGRHVLSWAVGATLIFAAWAAGQNAGTATPPRSQTDVENYKFTAHSNLAFLPTRVQSKHGETIYGLMPEEFIVEDNGVRKRI